MATPAVEGMSVMYVGVCWWDVAAPSCSIEALTWWRAMPGASQDADGGGGDEKPAKKAPKRSQAATIERMEKHKILERKRREKTKELVSELQGLIPSVETVPEGLTMNTVLEEAIEHLKAQHAKNQQPGDAVVLRKPDDGEDERDIKVEGAGSGGLARAFGQTGSDTRDVFNLIQNQIEDIGVGGAVAGAPGGTAERVSVLEVGLHVGMLERQHLGKTGVNFEVRRLPDHEDRQQQEERHHQATVAEDEVFNNVDHL